MEIIVLIIILGITYTYLDYQVKEKDKSIEGYINWMKSKYYKKKDQE